MLNFKVVLVLMVVHASGDAPTMKEYGYPSIEACVGSVQEKLNEAASMVGPGGGGDTYVAACRIEPVEGEPA